MVTSPPILRYPDPRRRRHLRGNRGDVVYKFEKQGVTERKRLEIPGGILKISGDSKV
jgi:hypothetical protein